MNRPEVFNLLAATAPFAEYAKKLMLYGQFIGSWSLESVWHNTNGGRRTGRGEWHFSWILGGRGIQDVIFRSGAAPHEFGTTVRCYDAKLDEWQIVFMQPCSGEFFHLIGKKVGNQIVQETVGSDPRHQERWSFSEITPKSFLWRGESSIDGGATWFLEQEMRARRI